MGRTRVVSILVLAILFGGCLQQAQKQVEEEGVKTRSAWLDVELKDVATSKKFRISDFRGKPVLLESFAVWCPTCTEQQRRTKELKERTGEDIIHISLDTDPNEDEEKVRNHIEEHGFDWYYAVSPIELTQALIDEFGLTIISAPSVPMILICEDQSTRFLRTGIKFPDELISEVQKGC